MALDIRRAFKPLGAYRKGVFAPANVQTPDENVL